jgi:OmpA-OmpF porin, OOP family
MKLIATSLIAASALAALSTTAHAEGLYVGGSVGASHYKGDAIGSADTDRSDTGLKLYGGYTINRHLAVEAGVVDLGKASSSAGTVKSNGLFVDAVGTLPLDKGISAIGRVGLVNAETTDSINGAEYGTRVKVGAGLQYQLDRNISLRGEWERYNLGTRTGNTHTDLYTVGVNYKF